MNHAVEHTHGRVKLIQHGRAVTGLHRRVRREAVRGRERQRNARRQFGVMATFQTVISIVIRLRLAVVIGIPKHRRQRYRVSNGILILNEHTGIQPPGMRPGQILRPVDVLSLLPSLRQIKTVRHGMYAAEFENRRILDVAAVGLKRIAEISFGVISSIIEGIFHLRVLKLELQIHEVTVFEIPSAGNALLLQVVVGTVIGLPRPLRRFIQGIPQTEFIVGTRSSRHLSHKGIVL